jgi:DNA-binding LytR/AlgR family response regulator
VELRWVRRRAHARKCGRRQRRTLAHSHRVKSVSKIVIVPVASIIRLEAEDNYVRLWADRA